MITSSQKASPRSQIGRQLDLAGYNQNFNVYGSADLVNLINLPMAAAPVYQFDDLQATNVTPRY